jgi:hypothetical protein
MVKKRGFYAKSSNLDSSENSFKNKLDNLNNMLNEIESTYGKDFSDIINLIKNKRELKKNFFPITILNKKLGVTESIVRYLKDELGWNYKEISSITHRNEAVVGVMYRNSLKKYHGKLTINETNTHIPFTIFSKQFTAFESIILYLKEKEELRYSEIAKITGRDQRTIWTIYNRAIKKRSTK